MNSNLSIESTTVLEFDTATEADMKLGVDIAVMRAKCVQQAEDAGHPPGTANPFEVWVKLKANGSAQVVITQAVGSQANVSS